jgi:hypothetical protein
VLRRIAEVSREVCRAAGLALLLAVAPAPSAAQQAADTPSASEQSKPPGEGTILEEPAFGPLKITEGIRIQFETFAAPEARAGSGHVTLVRPEINARGTLPVNDKAVLRVTMRLAESRYRFHGDVWGPPSLIPTVGSDPDAAFGRLDLHSAALGLEGAYRLSSNTQWFAEHEEWGAIGALYAGSRWEDDSFHSGLGAGGAIGVGYETPKTLRLALGVSLRTPLDETDVDVGPLFSLRWRPIDRFTLRTRELGLQAEYVLTPVFEVFLAGYRSTDRYRLNDRAPLGELSFRDRRIQVGAGFEWKLSNWLRLSLEGGSIVDRRLRVREEDLGTLLERNGDPSGYFELRVELRL